MTANDPGAAPQTASVAVPLASAERFFENFERSSKRWERIVYPGMVLVVLFLAYGFYLIYSLTGDMRSIVKRLDTPQMIENISNLSQSMKVLTGSIDLMARNVQTMAADTSAMSANTAAMSKSTAAMTKSTAAMNKKMNYLAKMDIMTRQMQAMNLNLTAMNSDLRRMRYDFATMNRNVSRPLSMMNSFMPFGR